MGVTVLTANSVGRAPIRNTKTTTGTTPAATAPVATTNVMKNVQKPSSSNTSTSVSPSTSTIDYQAQLNALYAQQQAQAQALAAQQRAAAESAYRAGMSRLGEAWDTKTGALRDNLNSTLSNLQRQYDASKGEVTNDANKSLREAYINYMLNKKDLNQNLTAQGIGGGAAESTMAGMYNNYGNSRNNINTTLNDNLTSLENTYQGNLASAQQQYNNAYANAYADYMNMQNQMEQNLANSIVGSYGSMINSLGNLDTGYTNALYDLLSKQAAYAYNPTQNTLGVKSVSTTSANNMGSVTDYAKQKAAEMRQQGYSNSQIVQQLAKDGVGINEVYQMFGV